MMRKKRQRKLLIIPPANNRLNLRVNQRKETMKKKDGKTSVKKKSMTSLEKKRKPSMKSGIKLMGSLLSNLVHPSRSQLNLLKRKLERLRERMLKLMGKIK